MTIRSRLTVDGVIAVVDAPAVAEGRFADDPEAEHHRLLDNVEGDLIELLPPPVDPMTVGPDGTFVPNDVPLRVPRGLWERSRPSKTSAS